MVAGALFCKDCGAPLGRARYFEPNPGFNPMMAALLSIIPGLGHVYKGRVGRAIMWFFLVPFAYTMSPALGILMHLICAANAALRGALRDEAFVRAASRRRRGGRRQKWSAEGS